MSYAVPVDWRAMRIAQTDGERIALLNTAILNHAEFLKMAAVRNVLNGRSNKRLLEHLTDLSNLSQNAGPYDLKAVSSFLLPRDNTSLSLRMAALQPVLNAELDRQRLAAVQAEANARGAVNPGVGPMQQVSFFLYIYFVNFFFFF